MEMIEKININGAELTRVRRVDVGEKVVGRSIISSLREEYKAGNIVIQKGKNRKGKETYKLILPKKDLVFYLSYKEKNIVVNGGRTGIEKN